MKKFLLLVLFIFTVNLLFQILSPNGLMLKNSRFKYEGFYKIYIFQFHVVKSLSCLKKHFTDQQIANMIPNYFYREHNSPNIKRIRVYGKDNEKYLHIEIDGK